jgi:HK97 family phage major capsid protein
MAENLQEIKNLIEDQNKAWHEFKGVNDHRLAEIEKRQTSDPLTEKSLEKINSALDDYKDRLDKIETSAPCAGSEDEKSSKGDEYKDIFANYVRKGIEPTEAELKTLSVASDPDGGYLVTPQMSSRIIKKVFETSPMRQVASVETISTDSLEFIVDNDEAASAWTSEQGSVSDTDTPTIDKKSIYVHEQYAMPKATQKLLDDASLDVESWLADKVSDVISRTENTAFISGDGNGKPRGILTYTAGTSWGQVEQISSTSGTAATLDSDDFIALLYGLKESYAANASFAMNRSTVKAARQLKENTSNQYIWAPGLTATEPDSILGRPVYQFTDMPALGTDSLSVACADFGRAYQIVDRTGIRVLRDPYSSKPFIQFYTTKRVGGDVVNFEAIKLLKMDA